MFKFNLKFLSSLILAGGLSSALWSACATNIDLGGNELKNVYKISAAEITAPAGGNLTLSGTVLLASDLNNSTATISLGDKLKNVPGKTKVIWWSPTDNLLGNVRVVCGGKTDDGSTEWYGASLDDLLDPNVRAINSPRNTLHHFYGAFVWAGSNIYNTLYNPVSDTWNYSAVTYTRAFACVSWQ